jgi:multicomponent Na+:H+ antiporter subunit C
LNLLLIVVIALSLAAGVYMLLSRDLFRMLMGLAVLGSATNLILFFVGRPGSLTPPLIVPGGAALPADAANPLTQALVLTAIVIGFALLAFALVLGARLVQQGEGAGEGAGHDLDRLQASEPPAGPDQPPGKPPVLES